MMLKKFILKVIRRIFNGNIEVQNNDILPKLDDLRFYNLHNNNLLNDIYNYLRIELQNVKDESKVRIDELEKRFIYVLSALGYSSQTLNAVYNTAINNTARNKKAVVTALTGDYEDLKTPLYAAPGWDYICFTDDPNLKSSFWKVVCLNKETLEKMGAVHLNNARLHAKFYKQMIHVVCSYYVETLWCDASFRITMNIEDYINQYSKNHDMLCVAHPYWDCIYEEARRAIELGTDDPNVITKQVNRYRDEGFPEHFGQITGFLLYRKHTDAVKRLNEAWYNETMNNSNRDQMSFKYCCWKLNFEHDVCSEDYYSKSPYFVRDKERIHKHLMPWERGGGYNDVFFRTRKESAKRSAEIVVPEILEILPVEKKHNFSVVDFGCATGDWLSVYERNGCIEILGINDVIPPSDLLEIPQSKILAWDIIKQGKVPVDKKFTICQCLEVAEHFEEEYADKLLQTLTSLSDIIVFSAAIPYQEGTHHVNLQWPDYWISKFTNYGYKELDCIRRHIWNNKSVTICYKQNLFIFFVENLDNQQLSELRKENRTELYNIVHPDHWLSHRGSVSL
jgi:hypothetical protein